MMLAGAQSGALPKQIWIAPEVWFCYILIWCAFAATVTLLHLNTPFPLMCWPQLCPTVARWCLLNITSGSLAPHHDQTVLIAQSENVFDCFIASVAVRRVLSTRSKLNRLSNNTVTAEAMQYCRNYVLTVQLNGCFCLCVPSWVEAINLKRPEFYLMSCNRLCHMPGELLTRYSMSAFLPPSPACRLSDDGSKQALTGCSGIAESLGCYFGNAPKYPSWLLSKEHTASLFTVTFSESCPMTFGEKSVHLIAVY